LSAEKTEEKMQAENGAQSPAEAQPDADPADTPEPRRRRVLTYCLLFSGLALASFMATLVAVVMILRAGGAGKPPERAHRIHPEGRVRQTAGSVAQLGPALDELPYDELIQRAHESSADGDYMRVSELYRLAAKQARGDMRRVLFARYGLSRALSALGLYDEAVDIAWSLRSVSEPGDGLWKHALVVSIHALGQQKRWDQFFQDLYLLKANSARYSDKAALDCWLAYRNAVAWAQICFSRAPTGAPFNGATMPVFGKGLPACEPLSLDDVPADVAPAGEGSVSVERRLGRVDLRSERAPLRQVLRAVRSDVSFSSDAPKAPQRRVRAFLEAVTEEQALEALTGLAGLEVVAESQKTVIRKLDLTGRSAEELLRTAASKLQAFLMVHPESEFVPEAYYALGSVYLLQGSREMAVGQLEVLTRSYSRSPWAMRGHYVAGRILGEKGNWDEAEREMLRVLDGGWEYSLAPDVLYWVGVSMFNQEKYAEAVRCFQNIRSDRLLAELRPEVLYDWAFCMEQLDFDPAETEERYREVKTRYPLTPYAGMAECGLARLAVKQGDYAEAIRRYESYLRARGPEGQFDAKVYAELLKCYFQTGSYYRAVLLAQDLVEGLEWRPAHAELVALVVEAYERAEMQRLGLRAVVKLLGLGMAGCRQQLLVKKAGFLLDMKSYGQVRETLEQIDTGGDDPECLVQAQLLKAKLQASTWNYADALELCRQIALNSSNRPAVVEALQIMSRCYEALGERENAMLVYEGKCPVSTGEQRQ